MLEQEPGAAGVAAAQRYTRHVLRGYPVYARPATGDKHTRAWPVAAAAENGTVKLVRGRHTGAFLDELSSFPHGKHDDCIDALSGAHTHITIHQPARLSIPQGRIDLPTPGLSYAQQRYPQHDPQLEAIAHRIGATIWPSPPPGISRR